jgi:hypothetical protein
MFRCAVQHNNRYTLVLPNISLYFVLQEVSEMMTFLSFFFPSSYDLFHTLISERDFIPLCFNKDRIQSNQQMALW